MFAREIKGEFSPSCADSLIVCYSSIRLILIQIRYEMAEMTPFSQRASSKSHLSMLSTKKKNRFTREVLLYSGFIIEKGGWLPQIGFTEWLSSQQIRLTSAEFRAGINCDRRK
jgi:hypothetical protein